jgi:hypothetical protein
MPPPRGFCNGVPARACHLILTVALYLEGFPDGSLWGERSGFLPNIRHRIYVTGDFF